MTLDQGSGFEQDFKRKTSCSCNIFGLFKYNGWDEFSSNTSLIYAGHNTFHLLETVGHLAQSESIGALRSLNLYFTANAGVSGTGTLSNADVNLHLDITAKGDRKAIASMAHLLKGLGASSLARDLAAFGTNQRQGTAELNLTISSNAYGRISYSSTGTDLTADARNWQAFAAAADDLAVWPLQPDGPLNTSLASFLKSFQAWEQWNRTATGGTTPDRTRTGNASAAWPDSFPSVTLPHALVVYSMLAGQHFMNFCASLKKLADLNDGTSTNVLWTDLNKQLTDALKQESDVDFISPAILAVLRLCGAAPTITGPTPASVPTQHFVVTLNA